ncbi:hypothetical protein BDZ97DRAFT_1763458 [Flammula alnicola]|nr:hypothetical protein BDZ97DRAFT_1763458 [Flammula alnicola]
MSNPTIPTDVLSQIFEGIVDADSSTLYTVRSVNREWLETAAITPKLWSTVNLSRKIHFTDAEYVRLHLENAGELPLSVVITLHEDIPYDNNIPAIGLLRERVHKIKSLTLDMPSREAWQKFVTGIGEGQPAPILERFVLRAKEQEDDPNFHLSYITLATAFNPSPNLTHLQLPAWPLPAQPPPHLSTVISLSLLTNFYEVDIAAVITLILAAPRLQDFNFRVDGEYGQSADPHYTNIISVPNLRKADVTYPGYGVNLLGNFRSPGLIDARLDGYRAMMPESDYELDDWGILNVLALHSPNIRRFELSHVFLEHPHEDYLRILSGQIFPVLEELILERTNLSDAALIESAGLRPSLKKLELRRCKYISGHGLQTFVQGGVSSDFLLIVKACRAIQKEDVEWLSSIVPVEYTDT